MLSFAEFCAGIGGFRLGLERIGWSCVFSCEIDDQCENTYKANFQTGFNEYDIADIRPSELPYFDVLCAGFPCQSFSIAGKRLGFDDRRGNVIFYLLEIIKFVQPPIILLENVPNFASHNNGLTLRTLKDELRSMGYSVSFATLDSSFFGIPQQRKRLYIVGFHQDTNNAFSFTRKRTESIPFRPFIEYGDYSIPISNKWQEYIDLYTERKTLEQISFPVPKTRIALERVNVGVDLDNCIFQLRSSGIRACSIDAPLPTFAVSHSGGGAMIPVYSGERRHITITEIKRIMGFPDNYNFPVARTHAIKQLSNAVCPPVISSIGKDIAHHLQLPTHGDEVDETIVQSKPRYEQLNLCLF